jgi:hypothetical protein
MSEKVDARSAVVTSIRAWPRPSDLASFAAARHGFGDTDGGFGVTYPGDLDEYDRASGGVTIPNGFVEVYGHWGPSGGYSLLIRESMYLDVLAGFLAAEGLHPEAERVEAVRGATREV